MFGEATLKEKEEMILMIDHIESKSYKIRADLICIMSLVLLKLFKILKLYRFHAGSFIL